MNGLARRLVLGGILGLLVLAPGFGAARAQDFSGRIDPSVRPAFAEPVTLASKDGVLEVRLTIKQDEARLDTVATPVKNFLLFGYELIRGTASNGQASGEHLYPA